MIYAGTSGMGVSELETWILSSQAALAKFLNHYATRLNTVEVNYTFRRFPNGKVAARLD